MNNPESTSNDNNILPLTPLAEYHTSLQASLRSVFNENKERYEQLIEKSNLLYAAVDFFAHEVQVAHPTYSDFLRHQEEIKEKYADWLWEVNHPWHE